MCNLILMLVNLTLRFGQGDELTTNEDKDLGSIPKWNNNLFTIFWVDVVG